MKSMTDPHHAAFNKGRTRRRARGAAGLRHHGLAIPQKKHPNPGQQPPPPPRARDAAGWGGDTVCAENTPLEMPYLRTAGWREVIFFFTVQ